MKGHQFSELFFKILSAIVRKDRVMENMRQKRLHVHYHEHEHDHDGGGVVVASDAQYQYNVIRRSNR